MGRGLSDLQKAILRIAARLEAGGDGEWRDTVKVANVLAEVYGCPFRESPWWSATVTKDTVRDAYPGTQVFQDTREARAARAAVSRAFRRLEARGLLESRYFRNALGQFQSWGLTDAGREWVQSNGYGCGNLAQS